MALPKGVAAMNLGEFAALKVGDEIENLMNPGSRGQVTERTERGVCVQWGVGMSFLYSVNSTAWMHWSNAEPKPSLSLEHHQV